MCNPGDTYSWLFVPIIDAALNHEGGILQDFYGYARPMGFDSVVQQFRDTFLQHNITAQGSGGSNGYVGATKLLSLNPHAHTIVDAYAQRVAAAVQGGNESLIPQGMDVMPSRPHTSPTTFTTTHFVSIQNNLCRMREI